MGRKRITFKIKDLPKSKRLGKVFGAEKRDANEKYCAKLLKNFGYDIIFLPESKISGVHTPDILWKMDGKGWEIKTLFGNSYSNVAHALAAALLQSEYIIINATKTKRDIRRIATDIIKYSGEPKNRRIKEIIIISKSKYCHMNSKMLQ